MADETNNPEENKDEEIQENPAPEEAQATEFKPTDTTAVEEETETQEAADAVEAVSSQQPETKTEEVEASEITQDTGEMPSTTLAASADQAEAPRETAVKKKQLKIKNTLLLVSGIVVALLVAMFAYLLVFNKSLGADAAFKKALGDLASQSYVDFERSIDTAYYTGTLTTSGDYSDIENPKTEGTFAYQIIFNDSVSSISEDFVAHNDKVLARLTQFESPERTQEELPIELNKWVVVAEGSTILTNNFAVAPAAYSLNTALGGFPLGNYSGEAQAVINEQLGEAYTYDIEEVTEEELDGEQVYKIPVATDTAKIVDLNKRLNEEFGAFAPNIDTLNNAANYYQTADLYISKSGELKKIVVTEQGGTLEIKIIKQDEAPEITLPEAEQELTILQAEAPSAE